MKDATGTVIYNHAFRTRGAARRSGRAITTWPLNTFEVQERAEGTGSE